MSSAVETSPPKKKRKSSAPSTARSLPQKSKQSIGARLRLLRKQQKMTLIELSKASEVDIATISRIETGRMTGTLECHIKLASALGAKITDVYAGIEEERIKDAVTVQSGGERSNVYVHDTGRSSLTLLTSDIFKKKLMPVLITVEANGRTNAEEAKVGTEKFLYVLEGQVEVVFGERSYSLKKSSTLYCDASVPHYFHNPARKQAKILSVVTPPVL